MTNKHHIKHDNHSWPMMFVMVDYHDSNDGVYDATDDIVHHHVAGTHGKWWGNQNDKPHNDNENANHTNSMIWMQ